MLNINASDFNGNGKYYDDLITESANAGKTVVVNVLDAGSVVFSYSMNATTVGGGLGNLIPLSRLLSHGILGAVAVESCERYDAIPYIADLEMLLL